MIQRDIRGTRLYQRATSLYRALRVSETAQVSDVAEVQTSPNIPHFAAMFRVDTYDNPAAIDYADRVVGWSEEHMPVDVNGELQGVG